MQHLIADLVQSLEARPLPAILLSPTYEVLAANLAYVKSFGGGVVGRKCHEVSHHYDRPCDQHGETCPLAAARDTRQPARSLHVHHTPRGLEHVDVLLEPVLDAEGSVVAYMEILQPVDSASADPRAGHQVGRSRRFNEALELALRSAPAEVPVLLLGESGTGKERMARAIHEASPRATGPFVAVACSGLSESLIEAELFGHERGAFTGATARRAGLVEAAGGGTLFLDEIGDVPLAQQVKLLRLLESRSFRRVGGTQPIAADFRLVCATWRDLNEMVRLGSFRQDLYFRIAAFPIELPPLRDRKEDLPILVRSILEELGTDKKLAVEALGDLHHHHWPGNVRELRNLLQRAVLLADGERIESRHLRVPHGWQPPTAGTAGRAAAAPSMTGPGPWPWGDAVLPLAEVEATYLQWCADRPDLERRALAEQLGVSERTLYRKLSALSEG